MPTKTCRLPLLLAVGARSWPSFRLVPLNPCQGRGQARLRVYLYQAIPPSAVVLRLQTGLTANLQGFRIRAPEGWPLLQRRASTEPMAPRRSSGSLRVRREPGAAVARQGLRAAGPATASVSGSVKCPVGYGRTVIRRIRDSALVARRFCMVGASPRRARRALEDVKKVLTETRH